MFYPTIQESQLSQFQVIISSLAANPQYLEDPTCPYNDTIKGMIRKMIPAGETPSAGGDRSIFDDGADKVEAIEHQLATLIQDLTEMGKQLSVKDHSEKIAFFKTKAMLIDKLVGIRERLFNLKEMSEFQAIIIKALEDICTADQVTKIMKMLEHLPSVQESKS